MGIGDARPVDGRRHRRGHGLDVRRVVAGGAAHEGVLADLGRREELLAGRAAHRPGHGRHDDELEAEPVEGRDVRVAVALVRALQAGVVDVERVRVLHDELASAQDAGAGSRLVAELRLDLVDHERQVLVGGVLALDQQREHLLVRRAEEVVRALAVLEAEEGVPVLRPAVGLLVRLPWEQRREVHLLEAGAVHLVADGVLDVAVHEEAEGQPGEDARRHPPHVAAAHEEPVARHLGVGRVVTERAQEQGRHPQDHVHTLTAGRRPLSRARRPPERSGYDCRSVRMSTTPESLTTVRREQRTRVGFVTDIEGTGHRRSSGRPPRTSPSSRAVRWTTSTLPSGRPLRS